jgi:hypothetical protein
VCDDELLVTEHESALSAQDHLELVPEAVTELVPEGALVVWVVHVQHLRLRAHKQRVHDVEQRALLDAVNHLARVARLVLVRGQGFSSSRSRGGADSGRVPDDFDVRRR